MAKKIDTTELIGKEYESNSYGSFLVLEYIGKDKDYMYKILFTNTQNEEIVNRKSIISLSCVDKKEKEKTVNENKKKRQQDEQNRRRHLNKFKGKEIYHTNKQNLRVLSLDQSSNYTGYAIFNGMKLETCGLIDLKTNNYSYLEKAITVESLVLDLIEKNNIDLVIMEDIYLGMNLEVYKVLCTVQSHLMITLIKNKVNYIIVSAPQWKSFTGISAKSKERAIQKKLSLSIVESKFSVKCTHDDISDAILIGWYGINDCIKYELEREITDPWNVEVY